MARKLPVTILLVLLSFFAVTPASAEKSYYAERFDVQIDLQEGGAALVTETVEFHFSGDPFTFAFREISATETDGITFLDASMDGTPMSIGTQARQVEVEGNDPVRVTWHFSPASDAAHEFTVRYRVDGVIRKGQADTLIWRAVPEDHDYSIARSTITLTYPPQASLLEPPALDRNFDSAREDQRLLLTTTGLAEDEALILTARFSPDSLTAAAPQWQVQRELREAAARRALPFGFFAGIATILLGGFGFLIYVRANSRDLNISPIVSTANPPADVPPAVVGKLTGSSTFIGTIFDLAQRGILNVLEEKGSWGTKAYKLTRTNENGSLRPHEEGLLEALFRSDESQIDMSEVPARIASKKKLFDAPLEQELTQRGWLDEERKQKRTRLIGAGILVLLPVLALLVGVLLLGSGWTTSVNAAILLAVLIGVGLGLSILSLALLIYGGTFSVLTPAGEEQAARWKGFAQYLKQVSKGREPAIRPDTFERYLAYAAVFGLGPNWAKYFQNLGGVPLPIWFHAAGGSDADFGAMVVFMSISNSTGAGGAGSAGAGGASGGGSSGAG